MNTAPNLHERLQRVVETVNAPMFTTHANEDAAWEAVSFLQDHGKELLAALAPPSGEAVDAVVARACGVYDGAMIRLHGEESICNSDAMREVIEACAPKCMRLDCPCEMQIADCRYKSTAPQSAPVDVIGHDEVVVHREILENADAALAISNHKGSAWSEHESPRYEIRELLGLPYEKRTTPPPASQERGECRCPEHGSWIAADDIHRMVRDLDVAMFGDGAAIQASLCDLMPHLLIRIGAYKAASPPSSAAEDVPDFWVREDSLAAMAEDYVCDAAEQAEPVVEASINSCLTYSKPTGEQAQAGELQEEIQWALNGLPQLAINLRFEGQTSRADTVERIVAILRRLAGGLTVDDAMVETIGAALYIHWNDVNEQANAAYRKKVRAALVAALGAK